MVSGNRNGNGTNGDVNGSASTPGDLLSPSMHAMLASLQKKFSRGVHYNMKLLLRPVEKLYVWLSVQGVSSPRALMQSFDFNVPPTGPVAQPVLPNSHQS